MSTRRSWNDLRSLKMRRLLSGIGRFSPLSASASLEVHGSRRSRGLNDQPNRTRLLGTIRESADFCPV